MCLMDGSHQEIHLAENDCVTLLRFTLYIGIVWVYYTTTQLHSTVYTVHIRTGWYQKPEASASLTYLQTG